jgi:hypothetical protein
MSYRSYEYFSKTAMQESTTVAIIAYKRTWREILTI